MFSRLRPSCYFLFAAGLLLAGCRDAKIKSYRAPKDPGSASAPLARPEQLEGINDLPPEARGVPSGPLTEMTLPPGHPPIDGMTTTPAASADMASTAVPTPAAAAGLAWTAPVTWKPKAGSAMRKGSYAVSGPEGEADLSVTAFPGNVGGDLANINRWRSQVGLPPVADVADGAQPLEANGLKMLVLDAANNGTRILGAIVPRPGETWFFKLTGPDALVAREKPAFLEFLESVRVP